MIAGPLQPADWQFALVAIPLLLVFWSLVIAIVSLVGGWHNLAKQFRRQETTFRISTEPIEKFRWASLKMGPVYFPTNYGSCVTVTLSDDGLGLAVMPLIRPLHPPLLIPWNAIEGCTLGKELALFDRAKVQLREFANPLRIYGRAGRAVYRNWLSKDARTPRE
ncbi:MAG: hypothetical protein AB7G28_02905 [Pirellulales bacterium]